MQQTPFKLARRLVFAILCASLSPAHAEGPIFNVIPQIDLAETRMELASRPPQKYKMVVGKNLGKIRKSWRERSVECLDPHVARANLVETKAYLQAILKRIAEASQITGYMSSQYGVCVTPVEEPNGMFASLFGGPHLDRGVIEIAPKFLREFTKEDELALVIAHELSHYLLKDEIYFAYIQGTNRSMDEVAIDSEREADELAMRLIVNAGYDLAASLPRLKELRAKDSTHYDGTQLEDLRGIIMADLQNTGRTYAPVASGPYLPANVVSEINAYLTTQTAGL